MPRHIFAQCIAEYPASRSFGSFCELFSLLEYFMRHPGRALSRQAILADVWGYDEDPASNVVDVYVRYLRNRLGRVAAKRNFIVTVRGEGYRFDVPVGVAQAAD